MSKYHNFIGIDIGKLTFVASLHGNKRTHEYENTSSGINAFLKDFKDHLAHSLVVLETTGGCEMQLLLTLCDKKYSVHRANTRKVKSFIRSFGNGAKTDALDARALAFYGFERHQHLELFVPSSQKAYVLYELVQRRNDLKQMLVAEKNRLQSPKATFIKSSFELIIKALEKEVEKITQKIKELIDSDPVLRIRSETLQTIPGIGEKTAQNLLAFMPELGSLTRRQIASLAGLAPRANDSGKFKGYRHTGMGRQMIKPTLFLAAMAARRSHSSLKAFYERLIANGKKKMVALTALMRKIIVIANARLKSLQPLMPS